VGEEKDEFFLGLGSNIGDRILNIQKALLLLSATGAAKIFSLSRFYETPPELFRAQPDFINCAAGIKTRLTPRELLSLVKNIENRMGRKQTVRYGPRIIDIDILMCGSAIIRDAELFVPHEGLAERLFVLFPLAEAARGAVHPVSGLSVEELLKIAIQKSGGRHG
jgi:2-amino-4-hydroxy-6-hydroxymethyldihydropteridine diphosphokinase